MGLRVARSDNLGNAKAFETWTGNRFHYFFIMYGILKYIEDNNEGNFTCYKTRKFSLDEDIKDTVSENSDLDFGSNEKEFEELLYMPETMIIYRFLFEWLGYVEARNYAKEKIGNDDVCEFSTHAWKDCYYECQRTLPHDLWEKLKEKIESNDFADTEDFTDTLERRLLSFYTKNRNEVVREGSDLWIMKRGYEVLTGSKPSHYGKSPLTSSE